MNWCFAKVNNKLVEIYFEKSKDKLKILGHAYVDSKEYKTKKEQLWIREEATKFKFIFRNGQYKDLNKQEIYE